MSYILNGTVTLMNYYRSLGRPCSHQDMANAVKQPRINFIGNGRNEQSFKCQYGEAEAQNLAAVLGTTVANVTTNGGQIQI